MFQIRIHGRGGQGVVSGAELLSVAAFLDGRGRLACAQLTLLHQVELFNDVPKRGYILVNSTKSFDELGLGGFARGVQQYRLCTVAATELAMKHVGRPVPNVPLLGAFAAITDAITLPSLVAAIREKFPAAIAEKNVAAATEAFDAAVKTREAVNA